MTTETVYSAFNRAWSHEDLDGKYPGKVRVYDLRHRFASACLDRWLDHGENLMAMLPFLRAYMGHSTLSETAYYIHILDTGARVQEIHNIKLCDLQLSRFPKVTLFEKGRKTCVVPLREKTVQHFKKYMLVFHKDANAVADLPLFYSVMLIYY